MTAATVADPVWALPVSADLVDLCAQHDLVVTLEDGGLAGGLGTRVALTLAQAGVATPVHPVGVPQRFLAHASRPEVLEELGLTAQAISRSVVELVLRETEPARA